MWETWVKKVDPLVGKIFRRRAWQPTPVFLPGEFHGQRSPEGYNPWGREESDTTERLSTASCKNTVGGKYVPWGKGISMHTLAVPLIIFFLPNLPFLYSQIDLLGWREVSGLSGLVKKVSLIYPRMQEWFNIWLNHIHEWFNIWLKTNQCDMLH